MELFFWNKGLNPYSSHGMTCFITILKDFTHEVQPLGKKSFVCVYLSLLIPTVQSSNFSMFSFHMTQNGMTL
jgi:hypothetical protein